MTSKLQNNGIDNNQSLEKLTVKQLRQLLKEKGCVVSGKKDELIERLKSKAAVAADSSGKACSKKPKQWQHSTAKKELKRALLDPTSAIHNMSVDEIRNSRNIYKQYPNFPKYYRTLKALVEAEIEQVKADDIAVEEHLRNNPRKLLNRRGYPHWDTHAAKKKLAFDIANKVHERMTPCNLRSTRDEYKEFPPKVFAKRVSSEVAKQRAVQFWAVKRNKKGMAKYLENITSDF